jgi:hypothetical protein
MVKLKPKPRASGAIAVTLPGPSRKREPAEYRFRVTYRGTGLREPGCLMTWEVTGGRSPYQLALERTEAGDTVWHCSCADFAYRGEDEPRYRCKHVGGLVDVLAAVQVPAAA